MARFPNLKSVQPDDPFAGTSSYDIANFCPRGGEESEVIRVRIPKTLLVRAYDVLESKQIPEYKTLSDMLRDGIYHRLQYLADVYDYPEFRETLLLHQAAQAAEDREALIASRQNTIEKVRNSFDSALAARSTRDCQEALTSLETLIDDEASDDPFQQAAVWERKRMVEAIARL